MFEKGQNIAEIINENLRYSDKDEVIIDEVNTIREKDDIKVIEVIEITNREYNTKQSYFFLLVGDEIKEVFTIYEYFGVKFNFNNVLIMQGHEHLVFIDMDTGDFSKNTFR